MLATNSFIHVRYRLSKGKLLPNIPLQPTAGESLVCTTHSGPAAAEIRRWTSLDFPSTRVAGTRGFSCRRARERSTTPAAASIAKSGSSFTYSAIFRDNAIKVEGETRSYRETRAAGRWHETSFCVVCGVSVISRLEVFPHLTGGAVGCFSDPDFEPPGGFYWAARRHRGLATPEGGGDRGAAIVSCAASWSAVPLDVGSRVRIQQPSCVRRLEKRTQMPQEKIGSIRVEFCTRLRPRMPHHLQRIPDGR